MRKIFFPICSNGGGVDPRYMASVMGALFGRDVSLVIINVADPHPANVLNRATHVFRNHTDCDEMLLIDADQEVTRDAVDRLLSHDLDKLGAVWGWYHKKVFPPEACVVGLPDDIGCTINKRQGLKEFRAAGRGFCRISREAIEDLIAHETLQEFTNFGPEPILEIWKCGVNDLGEFEHEDFDFCRRVRALGYRVMVDTSAHVLHIGPFAYGTIPDLGGHAPARKPEPEPALAS